MTLQVRGQVFPDRTTLHAVLHHENRSVSREQGLDSGSVHIIDTAKLYDLRLFPLFGKEFSCIQQLVHQDAVPQQSDILSPAKDRNRLRMTFLIPAFAAPGITDGGWASG